MDEILSQQLGVISRRQVLADKEGTDELIERKLRRREWRTIHPGVYVDHTGVPTPEQLRIAAVLFAWPAALVGESALIAHGARNVTEDGVRIGIDERRRVRPPDGVEVIRIRRFDERVLWNRMPPRVRVEDAALSAASRRFTSTGESGAVAVLADICQQRLTTPKRLHRALDDLRRLPGREFLAAVVSDVATGAHSLLEHRYLTRVERDHGLPRGRRQGGFLTGPRAGFRDVGYEQQGVLVELDGRLGHEFAADQWADLERDLLSASDRQVTTRLGWGAVADPCRLAPMVGRLLQSRGWSGKARRCTRCPDIGNLSASGAEEFPTSG